MEVFHDNYGVSLAIPDHTVLPAMRHKWTHPALTSAMQAGTRSTYPGGMEGWFDLVDDLIAPRPGVEPATFRSRVQCSITAPPRQPVIEHQYQIAKSITRYLVLVFNYLRRLIYQLRPSSWLSAHLLELIPTWSHAVIDKQSAALRSAAQAGIRTRYYRRLKHRSTNNYQHGTALLRQRSIQWRTRPTKLHQYVSDRTAHQLAFYSLVHYRV